MVEDHKVANKISVKTFFSKIEKFSKKDIEITEHALFRLNEGKRKIEQAENLKSILLTEKPLEILEQKNKNFAILYKFDEKKVLKILIRFSSNKLYIVTFYYLNKEQLKALK